LGGLDGAPCRAARAIAASGACDEGAASVIGLERRTTLEFAAFANSCMIRYLDFNDSYLTNGGGHTSDLIPAILAVAEQRGASGRDVIVALHVAYEVFAALADAVPMRDRGWDYPAFLEIAAAAGVANVMGLDPEQTGNAVSMAITPNLPLGVTRAGHLSNWKGLASPYGTMAAVFAARLAQAGMTGPPRAIEGVRGLWALATGPFSLASLGQPVGGLTAVERSSFKLYVAEFNAQGPVHEFVQLHHQGIRPDDVESIHIGTYEVGVERDRRRSGRPRPEVGSAEQGDRRPQPAVHGCRRLDGRGVHPAELHDRACARSRAATADGEGHRRSGRGDLEDLGRESRP
jgi:2-methylcitrate dehydratase